MKRLLLILALCGAFHATTHAAEPQKRSQNIVYIDGTKFYIHSVQGGETAASIARLYGVSEATLLQHNPTAKDGLKQDQTLKVPVGQSTSKEERSSKEAASQSQGSKPMTKKEEKAFKKTFSEHFISQGETLYSISRRYEISVDTILEDNPDADPQHLSIGQRLLIRKREIGRTDDQTAQAELARYGELLNSASVGEEYLYHVVQPKETIYSLARRYGLTEQELITLNKLEGGLKAGAILRIPNPDATAQVEPTGEVPQAGVVAPDSLVCDSLKQKEPREVIFKALNPTERLQVALLLPLTINGKSNPNFAAFYQGFLLGMEDVKHRGYSVDVTLYDTKRNVQQVEQLLESEEPLRRANLIVGPIYADAISPVLSHAERAAVPVVSPVGDLSVLNSDVLFQMAPTDQHKYDKLLPLLDEGAAITLIRTPNIDKEFEQEVLAAIGNRPYQYYDYISVQGAEHAERSDLTPLLKEHDKHLFFVLSGGEVDVDRILASLASAQTNMQARSQRVPEFKVVGSTRWNRYTNIDRTTFFKDRVILFAIFHAKRDGEEVVRFDKRYLRHFGRLPNLYAYRGYETAMIFCPAMFSDIEYDMEGRRYHPLQTPYTFGQREGSLSHINCEWVRVSYNPDFTITIE